MSGVNNALTVIGNDRERCSQYEELLLKRDQLFRECGSIMTSYTKEFGDMITANFELKIECIKKKKTINYCRRRMNRGLAIDTARMNAEIEQEMTLYYNHLKEMLTTEPYTYLEILENEDKKQAYKDQLQAEHDDYEQYLKSLTKTLDEMLHEEGVTLVWKMN